jgi:hypothetical protein
MSVLFFRQNAHPLCPPLERGITGGVSIFPGNFNKKPITNY